jgi:hypothetical protein
MSAGNWFYAAGMLLLFIVQRLSAFEEARTSLTVFALVVAFGCTGFLRWRALQSSTDPGVRTGHRAALGFLVVGAISVAIYFVTTDAAVAALAMAEDAEDRWLGVWSSVWPLVWLLGTLPLFVIDYAVQSSPKMMPARRVHHLASHALIVAMGVGLVFPLNYVATKSNERWDLAYFKTPTPGTATHAVVDALQERVHVRIFMPPSSEVALELRTYFAALEGPNLVVEILDQAAHPRLAQTLTVRDNGVIAFTVGEVRLVDPPDPSDPSDPSDPAAPEADDGEATAPPPVTRTLRVATDLEQAKRTLRKIDTEVQQILIELGHGQRTAYVTIGHGELTWQGGNRMLLQRAITGLKDDLDKLGFTVKPLGLQQDLGQRVPEDADLVLVLGPIAPFSQAEVDALRRYVESGGSLLVAFETDFMRQANGISGPDPLHTMVQEVLGVRLGSGVLAGEKAIFPMARDLKDRLNVITNSFTSHASSRTVAEHSTTEFVVAPLSGHLELVEGNGSETTVTFTARSLAVHWADLNFDFEFQSDQGETKEARNLVGAVEGTGGTPFRAVVVGGSTLFSDLVMGNRGNRMLAEDMAKWLVGAEALSGTTESEEDIKIEHTKEGQATWFYLTVLGVPLLIMVLGAVRIRMRRVGQTRGGGRPVTPDEAAGGER